jgi:uncharacterized protein (TIGR02001 family)
MKTYLTLSAIALAAAATLSSGTVLAQAAAPAAAPEFTVTGNFGITSDYRFRGLSQNNQDPSVQGGFDLAHSSGLYIGTWGSNVSQWAASETGSLELDLYGGYKTAIGEVGLDIGAIAYKYPGSLQSNRSNTEEVYVGLSYGPAVFKTSYVTSKNYFASVDADKSAKGTVYYDLTISQEVMPKLVASAHAGYTKYKESARALTAGDFSYADYSLGLAYDLNGYVFGVKYFFNDLKADTKGYTDASSAAYGSGPTNVGKDGFAVSLVKAF